MHTASQMEMNDVILANLKGTGFGVGNLLDPWIMSPRSQISYYLPLGL